MSAVKNAEGTQKLSVFKMTWPIFIEGYVTTNS